MPVKAADRILLEPDIKASAKVEIFVSLPAGEGPFPAILYVHGHQENRIGGRDMVDSGALERMAQRGYVAASVSQPGYGGSDGPPDYSGPATQQAIRAALAHLRDLPKVDRERMALYGVSRGAIASAIVAAEEPELKALILLGGVYDYPSALAKIPPSIKQNIEKEAGTSSEALAARSSLGKSRSIRAATLILHGRHDENSPPDQAEALAAAMRVNGQDVSLEMIDSGHVIPFRERARAVDPFLARVLAKP